MKVCDVQRGKSTVVQVKASSADDFSGLSSLEEVELYGSEIESEALIRAGRESWTVEGVDVHQQALLDAILLRALPRMAWVAALRSSSSVVSLINRTFNSLAATNSRR